MSNWQMSKEYTSKITEVKRIYVKITDVKNDRCQTQQTSNWHTKMTDSWEVTLNETKLNLKKILESIRNPHTLWNITIENNFNNEQNIFLKIYYSYCII